MFKLLMSILIWGTIAAAGLYFAFHNDVAESLQQLGCLINGACNSND